MNIRREKFCTEYAASGNATRAAIAAGYSPNAARSQGARLLTYADVQKRITEINQEVAGEKIANVQTIQAFLTETMKDGKQRIAARLKAAEILLKSKGAAGDEKPEAQEQAAEEIVVYVPDNSLQGGGDSND